LYKATDTHLLPYLFGGGLLLLMLPLIPRIRRGEVVPEQPPLLEARSRWSDRTAPPGATDAVQPSRERISEDAPRDRP
jgi:hypothetical protein